jgi:hypothetical protein
MNDVPTLTDEDNANFATLNSVVPTNAGAVSDGNLTWTLTGSFGTKEASIQSSTLLQYAEFYVTSGLPSFGVKTPGVNLNTNVGTAPAGYWGIYDNGASFNLIANGSATYSTSPTVAAGQTWQVAYNPITGKAWIGKNNVWYNSSGGTNGDPATDANPTFSSLGNGLVMFVSGGNVSAVANANFGQRPFAYTPPTGFKKLNTYNLPDSTIKDGSEYMNTVTFSGTGATGNAITGLGFQPDMVWAKSRSVAANNELADIVRGTPEVLFPNLTNAEITDSTRFESFDSDGFTLGANANANGSGYSSVGWAWKANGSGVSNTVGDTNATVSANTTSGFSIVSFNAGAAGNHTVGHGLGVTPEMIIMKDRDSSGYGNWTVFHSAVCTSTSNYLLLNGTGALGSVANSWGSALPTSTVFGFGSNVNVAANDNIIAYCFAGVEGFSAFGSYTGNGSADGPFIYTGFRPAWLLVKRSDAAYFWYIHDAKRNTYNVLDKELYPNSSNAEVTATRLDFTSNGFKVRGTQVSQNASGGTYIYAAFAENPFKNSLAR